MAIYVITIRLLVELISLSLNYDYEIVFCKKAIQIVQDYLIYFDGPAGTRTRVLSSGGLSDIRYTTGPGSEYR